jgi:hypothetical protein
LSTHAWKGTLIGCIPKATYDEGPCVDDSTCKESLICRTSNSDLSLSSCNCPLNINFKNCDCPRSRNNETYWDGNFL